MANKGHQELDARLAIIEQDIDNLEDAKARQHIFDFGKVLEEMAVQVSDYSFDHTEQSFYIPVPNTGETSSTNSVEYVSGGTGYVRTQWNHGQSIVLLEENKEISFRQFKVIQRVFTDEKDDDGKTIYKNYTYLITQRVNPNIIPNTLAAKGTAEYSYMLIDESENE